MITELIDKQDNFEIIRDQVAAILAIESASQQALAAAAQKDPRDWEFDVFVERSNPWERYLDNTGEETPIVNVWYDNSSFDKAMSNIVERQGATATINVDCYAIGYSEETIEGQIFGDEESARNVQATVRLVRNILMAAPYTYLGLRGVVGQRWISSTNIFQPSKDANSAQSVIGARLTLMVQFNEFSPQVQPVDLETLTASVYRAETGELVAKTQYDYGA